MEWQTIDSAPKDGSLVDLWWDGIRFVDCFWMNYNPSFPTRTVGWICAKSPGTPFSLTEIRAEPSHWMIINPPGDVEKGIPIYASRDATDDVLGIKIVVDPSMPPNAVKMVGPRDIHGNRDEVTLINIGDVLGKEQA